MSDRINLAELRAHFTPLPGWNADERGSPWVEVLALIDAVQAAHELAQAVPPTVHPFGTRFDHLRDKLACFDFGDTTSA